MSNSKAICPHCKQAFISELYYAVVGDSFVCDYCSKEIYIHSVDTIMEYELGVESPESEQLKDA
jgi:hypothetical protein